MAKKRSHLEMAIDAIDRDILVLQEAKQRLIEQQRKQAARKPRAVHQRPIDVGVPA